MTKKQLADIEQKLNRGKDLVDLITALESADPYKSGVTCRLYLHNTNADLLDEHVLQKVIALGVKAMIRQAESDLANLQVNTTGKS